jgi:hypothetical protein
MKPPELEEGFKGLGWDVNLATLTAAQGARMIVDQGPVEDYSGFVVAGAGDVNNDNFDDMLVSWPGADSFNGRVYLVYGGASLPVTIDLVEGGPQFGVSAEHIKLLEKIDCTIVPCSRLQPDKYPQTGYRIAQNLSATAMGYRTDKFPAGKEPQGWADFFDTKKQ